MSARDAILAKSHGRTETADFDGTPVLLRSLTMAEASAFSAQMSKWTPLEQYWFLCKVAVLDPDTKERVFPEEDRQAFESFAPATVMAIAGKIIDLSGIGPKALSDAGKGSDAITSST